MRKSVLLSLLALALMACSRPTENEPAGGSQAGHARESSETPQSDACSDCRERACRNYLGSLRLEGHDVVAGCFDPGVLRGRAEAGSRKGVPRVALCEALLGCSVRAPACGAGPSHECYCGPGVEIEACLRDGPRGACASETAAAAESDEPRTVAERFTDPQLAVGGASRLLRCYRDHCAAECLGVQE